LPVVFFYDITDIPAAAKHMPPNKGCVLVILE